jgi:hypothetical protein
MDYQNGKIYKITNCIDNEVYIGSTCTPLTKRWYEHKLKCKYGVPYKIYQYMTKIGIDKFSISLIEDYPCTNKSELRRREGEFIKEQGTLNDNIAGRTDKEWKEDNHEQLLEKKKEWYQNNKEQILEKSKEYYQDNKEKMLEKYKEYYQNNKEKKSKQRQERRKLNNIAVECDICKKMIKKFDISTHKKTKKCLAVSVESKTSHSAGAVQA